MPLFRTLCDAFLDAVFPVPQAERDILAMGAESAWKGLPRAKNSPVPEACSVFSYKDDRVWRLVWSIKYKKSAPAAAIAGHALYRVLCFYAMAITKIVIVPMPITSRRRRERGFNQCELMADEIEKLDTERRFLIVRDLLIRKRHTSRQTLKDRTERLESAQNIFGVNQEVTERLNPLRQPADGGEGLKNCFVIVIDDVITTGGTIKEAVDTLRKAGFENAYGLSLAH